MLIQDYQSAFLRAKLANADAISSLIDEEIAGCKADWSRAVCDFYTIEAAENFLNNPDNYFGSMLLNIAGLTNISGLTLDPNAQPIAGLTLNLNVIQVINNIFNNNFNPSDYYTKTEITSLLAALVLTGGGSGIGTNEIDKGFADIVGNGTDWHIDLTNNNIPDYPFKITVYVKQTAGSTFQEVDITEKNYDRITHWISGFDVPGADTLAKIYVSAPVSGSSGGGDTNQSIGGWTLPDGQGGYIKVTAGYVNGNDPTLFAVVSTGSTNPGTVSADFILFSDGQGGQIKVTAGYVNGTDPTLFPVKL